MKKFNLHITTDCQEELQLKKLAEKLLFILQGNATFKIVKTQELLITGSFLADFDSISQAAEISDRICSPWMLTFNREENEIELEFSKNTAITYKDSSFNTIQKATFKTAP